MKLQKTVLMLSAVLLVTMLAASQSQAQWVDWGRPQPKINDTSLSVFAVMDTDSSETGYGAAFTKYGNAVTDLSYVDLESTRIAQIAQLTPKQLAMFSANLGFALAYAQGDDNVPDAPDGFMSGLTVILAQSDLTKRIGLDIRASSLAEGMDPLAWLTDPDVFYVGAGLSVKF